MCAKGNNRQAGSNAGIAGGQKAPFTPDQCRAVASYLATTQHLRNIALFHVAISTCLRSGDLLALRARDVLDASGSVRPRFTVIQSKVTGHFDSKENAKRRTVTVTCQLSLAAGEALAAYIKHYRLAGDALLFPMTTANYRLLVKAWAAAVGLEPSQYAGHTTRRTLPVQVYRTTKDVVACAKLLGHSDNLKHTSRYVGVGMAEAFSLADAALKDMI